MMVRSAPLGPMACRPTGSPLLPLRTGMAVAGPPDTLATAFHLTCFQ